MNDYSLEQLAEKFAADAIEYESRQEEQREQYKENYPGKPLPHFMEKGYFSFPRALHTLTTEIMKLKGKS